MKYSKYVLLTFLPIFLALACKRHDILENPISIDTPTNFTATSGDSEVSLNWTNPDDSDFDKVIIQFTTSGDYPANIDDGKLVYEGSDSLFTHSDLANGTQYQYSIFALDVFGEASEASQASATPDASNDSTPPTDGNIRALTYNIKVAAIGNEIDIWDDTRRHLVMDVIHHNQPDVMGFQEAYDRRTGDNGISQKESLVDFFESTKWQIHCSDDKNNMNCVAFNTDQFELVEQGEYIIDIASYQGDEYFQQFWEYHDFFHENETSEDEYFTHTMTQYRYLMWVVVKDKFTLKNVLALASHYETYVPIPEAELDKKRDLYIERGLDVQWGEDIDAAYENFQIVGNDIFGYLSREIVGEIESIRTNYDTSEDKTATIVLVDAKTGDYTLPAQAEFIDAGFVKAFREAQPESERARRPTQGFDNIFFKLDALTISDAYYDQTDYSQDNIDPSDHTPYFADFTLIH